MTQPALAWQLCARYLFSGASQLATVSWIAVAGLGLSIAVLVVVLSVVNGFERELKDRLFAVLPHLSVSGRGPIPNHQSDQAALAQLPGVAGVAKIVEGSALAAVPTAVRGVSLSGIDPAEYSQVSKLGDFVHTADGRSRAALELLLPGKFGLLLGGQVAAELGVNVGDRVTLVLPQASVSLVGVVPRQKRVTVRGILHSQSELDSRGAYLHLRDAQRLFRLGNSIHGYQLRLHDLFAAQEVGRTATQALTASTNLQYRAQTWIRSHGNLYQAIVMQKQTMFLLLAFLVGVAAFNLISSLLMVVNQRRADVAILRTMGASTGTFVLAFTLLALALGSMGLLLGLGVGAAIASLIPGFFTWVNETTSMNLMSEYFVNYLPVEIRPDDLIGISLVTLCLTLVTAIYPAWRVSRTQPAEVLAHE